MENLAVHKLRNLMTRFVVETAGASLVEYAVALIVVTLVGAVLFALGGNVAGIIDASAGAF